MELSGDIQRATSACARLHQHIATTKHCDKVEKTSASIQWNFTLRSNQSIVLLQRVHFKRCTGKFGQLAVRQAECWGFSEPYLAKNANVNSELQDARLVPNPDGVVLESGLCCCYH